MKEVRLFSGNVASVRPVSKNRVQFEFRGSGGVYELFLDQSWVMSAGDLVHVAGYKDETGKHVCYAYSNLTKTVKGWNNIETSHEAIGAIVAPIFFALLFHDNIGFHFFSGFFVVLLSIFVLYGLAHGIETYKRNRLYEKSRQLVDRASHSSGSANAA